MIPGYKELVNPEVWNSFRENFGTLTEAAEADYVPPEYCADYLEAMLTEFPALAATEAQGTFDVEM